MTANTIEQNKLRTFFEDHSELWLFAYGSILYKIDFDYLEKRPAHIIGWERKLWQGSHDHRGTPGSPGRVVTLIESPEQRCDGLAILITPDVFEHLDIREKNGYLRTSVEIMFEDKASREGLVYIADPDNTAFLGHATDEDIALQIVSSSGPSGSNTEYVLSLAEALRGLGAHDEHVYSIERSILRYSKSIPKKNS
ncbi:MAG: gamma-glutamylcyclotransferase [Pseudomonadales bacterium]|nr:gamma-glutamylcyclotransferase [Pseudomonadales bacterium]